MAAAAVRFDGVWKSYPRWSGPRTVRGMLAMRVPALARRDRRWALRDVTLSVAPGETVGLIGQNGAGKSTLLRLASGLGHPTRGTVRRPEAIASVLSLGEAFDLNLTGRENATTTAIVAGFRQAAARRLMPAILEFAELDAFADAPMRTYSEGMKLRLAFGVIAQLRPDVLLLDEVIAVGDLRFQRKCLDRIQEMRGLGTGVLLASHSLGQVAAECDRAVWLEGGAIRAGGDSATVVAQYEDAMRSATVERTPAATPGDGAGDLELRRNRFGSQELTLEHVTLRGGDGRPTTTIATGAPLEVSLDVRGGGTPIVNPIVLVTVQRAADGVVCYELSSEADGLTLGRIEGDRRVTLRIERTELAPGGYSVDVGVYESGWAYAYDLHWGVYRLEVAGPAGGHGLVNPAHVWGTD
jgi:homopolymeric O-antigen transport system ATP-binding protein